MDKNIAALLRQDAKTIKVCFASDAQRYTYVTHLPVEVGDFVVTPPPKDKNSRWFGVARVMEVDPEVLIQPNDDLEYRWIVGVIDHVAYEENATRNEAIAEAVAKAYRGNIRKSFADQVLGALPKKDQAQLLKLTSGQ